MTKKNYTPIGLIFDYDGMIKSLKNIIIKIKFAYKNKF